MPQVQRILILAANPLDSSRLRLEEELREIEAVLQRAKKRELFELKPQTATRPSDIQQALLDYNPQIVHFCGHGTGTQGLVFEDDTGQGQFVDSQALANLFELFADQVKCVVLNACYSEIQAEAIVKHIDAVIGMNQPIGDTAAIRFAEGFYRGLGAGKDVEFAYKLGRNSLELQGIPEEHIPVLKRKNAVTEDVVSTQAASSKTATKLRIFISYKRDVTPDEPVAKQLCQTLQKQHRVFIDQKMPVGTPWVETIKQEIFQTDVLILLLSAKSIQSEMVQQEIELAHLAAEHREGLPRIFPVRLDYAAPFPYPLNQYLDSLQWAFWETPTDTERLITEIQHALAGNSLPIDTETAKQKLLQQATPAGPAPPTPLAQPPANQMPSTIPLEMPEGSMDTESEFYIERAEDAVALSALQRKGGTVTILGPRQMGKSSLLIRTLSQARQQQKKVVFLDFQRLETAALTEDDRFYQHFCEWITVRLRLPSQVNDYWQKYKSLGNPLRCTYYIQDYLLEAIDQSIFLAMDEVDKLIASPFRDEFFSMLRSWHNERAYEPVWKKLDLAMVTCTEPYQLIQDLNQSPFNVGTSITLKDFNTEEVAELNRLHNGVLNTADLQTLMDWLGGHPYLTRKALYEVASANMAITTIFDIAKVDQGPFGGHLRYHLFRMHDKQTLVQGMLQVIRSQSCGDEAVLRRLERAGLVRREGHQIKPRCRLYAEYFKGHLHE